MKTSEIRNLSVEDINKKIVENKQELFELRMKASTGNLEKPHMINKLRKDVARLKTVLTEKENDGSEN